MYGILLSSLFSAMAWIFRSVLIKFFMYFALFFVASEFTAYLVPKLPGAAALTQAFSGIPAGVWYVFDLFKLPIGIQLVLAAYVTRFAIRRIPVIG
jgi:hypothetical protein